MNYPYQMFQPQYGQMPIQNPYQFNPQNSLNSGFSNNPNSIVGKMISDSAEISANDVPMNGSPAIFPRHDLSEIVVRRWNSNGQIESQAYKPVEALNKPTVNDTTTIVGNDMLQAVNERLANIEKLLSRKGRKQNEPTTNDINDNE